MEEKNLKESKLAELLRPYQEQWVALAPDFTRVEASGTTLAETRSKLGDKEKREAYFMKVVAPDAAYEPMNV